MEKGKNVGGNNQIGHGLFTRKNTAAADAKLMIKVYHHLKQYFFFLILAVFVLQLHFCCFVICLVLLHWSFVSCCPT
jgi:hypothetical protein